MLDESKLPSFVSTSVVAKTLGLSAGQIRGLIRSGTLPAPQWMNLGGRTERVYSLEWLILASERLNQRRLPGLEQEFSLDNRTYFALRFDRGDWEVVETARLLASISALWELCARTLRASDQVEPPSLHVRRLNAGSPLDLVAWAADNWMGLVSTGGLASLVIYILKRPERVVDALPRALAAWRGSWADAADQKLRLLESRARLEGFNEKARQIALSLNIQPTDTSLNGADAADFDIITGDSLRAIDSGPLQLDEGNAWGDARGSSLDNTDAQGEAPSGP